MAREHARIADQRRDGLHKLTTRLMRENQTVCVESLAVKNLVRNRSLAKAISDAGWGELGRQLEYKAAWYGRTLVKIDRWYPSSKRCHVCGHMLDSLPLDVRQWTCPECGVRHDRDVNAARNVLAAARHSQPLHAYMAMQHGLPRHMDCQQEQVWGGAACHMREISKLELTPVCVKNAASHEAAVALLSVAAFVPMLQPREVVQERSVSVRSDSA